MAQRPTSGASTGRTSQATWPTSVTAGTVSPQSTSQTESQSSYYPSAPGLTQAATTAPSGTSYFTSPAQNYTASSQTYTPTAQYEYPGGQSYSPYSTQNPTSPSQGHPTTAQPGQSGTGTNIGTRSVLTAHTSISSMPNYSQSTNADIPMYRTLLRRHRLSYTGRVATARSYLP